MDIQTHNILEKNYSKSPKHTHTTSLKVGNIDLDYRHLQRYKIDFVGLTIKLLNSTAIKC